MSRFGNNLNQIKDGLPCRFQMFLVWNVGHRMQQLHLKFPIRKEERRENRLTLCSFLLIVKLQSSQVKRTSQDAINEFIIRKLNPLVVVDFRFISHV